MDPFVGRAVELRELREELGKADAGTPRLVVVDGAAGIGKTSLVRMVLAEPSGMVVRQAIADRTETSMAYGVIEQLFDADFADTRPKPALDSPAVGALLLDLLGPLQETGCVVLVVDDAHWADPGSLQALLFCLRRLHADRVALLLAIRSEEAHRLPDAVGRLVSADRGSRITLPGLTPPEARDLAEALGLQRLSNRQVTRLTEHTAGSPLHLTALLREATREALTSVDLPLPAPSMFALDTAAQLDRCSHEARSLVQAVAVAGGTIRLSEAAVMAGVTDALASLDEAIANNLLASRGIGPSIDVRPAHPLIGAAVYQLLSGAERAAWHLAASNAMADEFSRLRHRIAASTGPDEHLALQLAELARSQACIGRSAAAVAGLLSAGRVAASRTTREELMLEAIERSLFAADLPTALDLGAGLDGFRSGVRLTWVRGLLAWATGAWDVAERLLTAVWNESSAVPGDPFLSSRAAMRLADIHLHRGRAEEFLAWANRVLADPNPHTAAMDLAQLSVGIFLCGRRSQAMALVES